MGLYLCVCSLCSPSAELAGYKGLQSICQEVIHLLFFLSSDQIFRTQDPLAGHATLLKILDDARGTKAHLHNGLSKIHSVNEFRKRVMCLSIRRL